MYAEGVDQVVDVDFFGVHRFENLKSRKVASASFFGEDARAVLGERVVHQQGAHLVVLRLVDPLGDELQDPVPPCLKLVRIGLKFRCNYASQHDF